MNRVELVKPDGRQLILYSRRPIPPGLVAPSPAESRPSATQHLRYHPLRGEWIAYSPHRQTRTFLPPRDWNPLAPTRDSTRPTEVPAGDYDVAVFENRFPTFDGRTEERPAAIVPTRPAHGACEVVVFSQDPMGSLGQLPLDHLELLFQVWAERSEVLGARADVAYVMPFENRGVEVGVTLHHPHGQIYAYPVVPPIAARELELQRLHLESHGRGLLEELLDREAQEGHRLIFMSARVLAFVPVCARYAYEVWIAPRRPASTLAALDADDRAEMACALKTVLLKLDGLWQSPCPYVLVFHQAPSDGRPHPEAHVHVEIYPAYRMRGRLKYLAGSELGAGFFTADTLPEEKAAELAAVKVSLA